MEDRTQKQKREDSEAQDLMHSLDRMAGLCGKGWSVDFARRSGLSEDEIRKILSSSL